MEVTDMGKLRLLRCSFCGKKETEVLKLVAGQRGYICDKCVAIASQIMNDPPEDNQPPRVQPSGWRRLLLRARRYLVGGNMQRLNLFSVRD
jgi:ATP-dependent protease Clp ATPase subunit